MDRSSQEWLIGWPLSYVDTQGNAAIAVDAMMNYLYRRRATSPDGVPHAVLGPALSELAKPTALMAGAEQLPMLSYWASASELSTNRYFTRTFPSDLTAGSLLVRLLYGGHVFPRWNHVAVIYAANAWGQGYQQQMEVEFARSTAATAHEDVSTKAKVRSFRTLRSFSFTDSSGDARDHDSVALALDAVQSFGASVIVVVAFGSSLETLLEAFRARAAPAPVLHPCRPRRARAGAAPASRPRRARTCTRARTSVHPRLPFIIAGGGHAWSGDGATGLVHRRGQERSRHARGAAGREAETRAHHC